MKRLSLLLLSLFLGTAVLSGCDGNSNKTPLINGKMQGELVALEYSELATKIENEDNFLIFSTPSANCTCWNNFKNSVLASYIREHHVRAFTIGFNEFYDINNIKLDTFGITINSGHQTLAIFKNGQAKVVREYVTTHKIWTVRTSFEDYISELVITPTILDITLDQLNTIYSQTSSFTICFYDQESASSFLRQKALYQYALNHLTMNRLYLINCDAVGIKLNSSQVYDETSWSDFKDRYGLSTVNGLTFGYGAGVVPTFLYVEPNGIDTNGAIIKTAAVYLNDVLASEESEGTYAILDSFYTSERLPSLLHLDSYSQTKILKGMSIPLADTEADGEQRMWKREKAALHHDQLLNAFLNYSLPLSEYGSQL
ncbi:MAG: hypothetical protein WC282_01660 [Bacilli bacterium]|jgi:hypothetical protein